jgi:hypothetical protein
MWSINLVHLSGKFHSGGPNPTGQVPGTLPGNFKRDHDVAMPFQAKLTRDHDVAMPFQADT